MYLPYIICYISLLLVSLCGWITCTNVDTTEAVWFRGDERSYFGYSVNLYRYRNKPSMRYVLIGAPRANGSVDVFQTGNTYRCEPLDPTSCTPLNLPGLSGANNIDSSGNLEEVKDNMWMGATITSSYVTGTIATCGHRYVHTYSSNSRELVGRCYILANAEAEAYTYDPCLGTGCLRSLVRDCMSGTSAHYLEDGSQLYVGAPGLRYFRGSPFRGSKTNTCESGIFRQDVGVVGYLGYALTSGRLFNQQNDIVVVSAPRQNSHLGNIYLIENNTDTYLTPQFTYHGTSQDSYYGFSLLAVDLNGDGLDELLVSAPMYSLPGKPEIGQVHIYSSNGNSLQYTSSIIQQMPYSRFGTAIADLGDLNKDGYPEIAISAPYGNQSGSVFIYSGTPQGILSSQPIQTITGEKVGLERGAAFGVSVSGKQDMDDNGYNDILIGAYVNNSAFLFRTLPVATIYITPSSMPRFIIIDLDEAIAAGQTQNLTLNSEEIEYIYFILILPITFTTPDNIPTTMKLELSISADANEPSKNPRVFFLQNNNMTSVITQGINLTQSQYTTVKFRVFLKKNRNFLRPIPFDFEYSAVNYNTLDFNNSLSIQNPKGIPRYEVQPNLNCGDDRICIPDLSLEASVMLPTLPNDPSSRYGHIIAGEVTEFNISVEVSNSGEDSFGTTLQLIIPRGITYRILYVDDENLVIGCRNTAQQLKDSTTLSCSPLGNPLKGSDEDTVSFSVVFNSDSLRGNEEQIEIQLEVLSSNPEDNSTKFDNRRSVSINVTATADISTSVKATPEKLAFNESTQLRINHLVETENQSEIFHSDLGPEVTFLFLVHNNGPSPIINASLNIYWPMGVKNGDRINDKAARHFILYPTKYTSDKIRCDSTYFNVANLRETKIVIDEEDLEQTGRNTRSIDLNENNLEYNEDILLMERERRQTSIEPTKSNVVINTDVSCVNYHDYCVTIKCSMSDIPSGNSYELLIAAKVFEPTLAVNAPKSIWNITVSSEAIIRDTHVEQPGNGDPDTAQVAIKVIPSSLIGINEGFTQWWIILVAIFLFLLIMIPSLLALYFSGFFKKPRSNKAKLEQSRRENMEELTAAARPDFF
ncbi:Integrin alpha [Oopsacas minuta]|uniref:Integrin alpha n=1 Tax=Oopsacas minuta TaxID=111878 RepID=A0AAV7KCB4_9METZ|nr:Integrin alpha [Oopsacas minuta]